MKLSNPAATTIAIIEPTNAKQKDNQFDGRALIDIGSHASRMSAISDRHRRSGEGGNATLHLEASASAWLRRLAAHKIKELLRREGRVGSDSRVRSRVRRADMVSIGWNPITSSDGELACDEVAAPHSSLGRPPPTSEIDKMIYQDVR